VAEGEEGLRERLRRLERELERTRRSRSVLMDLLVRLDRRWQAERRALVSENRKLWRRFSTVGGGGPRR
jgi:hypothetical protein